jgi:hypothetical protein
MASYITSEAAARAAGDAAVQGNIDTAETNRLAGDAAMSSAIASLDAKFGYSGAPAVGAGSNLLLTDGSDVVRMNYKTVSGVVLLELHKGA